MIELFAVVGFKLLTLLLGALVTAYAYRAYRRTGTVALWLLAVGYGMVTVGVFVAGIVDQILPTSTRYAILVESIFTVVGFAIILYSLYA